MAEYAVVLAVITIAVVVTLGLLSTAISGKLTSVIGVLWFLRLVVVICGPRAFGLGARSDISPARVILRNRSKSGACRVESPLSAVQVFPMQVFRSFGGGEE